MPGQTAVLDLRGVLGVRALDRTACIAVEIARPVPPQHEPAARPENAVCLPKARLWLEPMPGLRADHQIERRLIHLGRPVLERTDVHPPAGPAGKLPPSYFPHRGAKLDADPGQSPRGKKS